MGRRRQAQMFGRRSDEVCPTGGGWLEFDFESDTKELRSSDRRWPTASAVGWGVWKSEPRSGERPFSWIGILSPLTGLLAIAHCFPTACAVDYPLPPLRG